MPFTKTLFIHPHENEFSSYVFKDTDSPPTSLDTISRMLPGGAYTTFRTYDNDRAFHLEDHLKRLEDSAVLAGKNIAIRHGLIHQGIRQVIKQSGFLESRIRLTLDLEEHIGTIYISIEKLALPSADNYANGVKTISLAIRRQNAQAKLTNFIATADEMRHNLPPGIHEAIMVDADENLLEGLSSNFFGYLQGTIYTAEEGVLLGVTRRITLEETKGLGFSVQPRPLKRNELQNCTECFITSSSRGVLPVVEMDTQPIGNGKPGPATIAIGQRYSERVMRESEII